MKILQKILFKSRKRSKYNVVSINEELLKYLSNIQGINYFAKYDILLKSIFSQNKLKQNDIIFVDQPIKNSFIELIHSSNYLRSIEEALLFGDYAFEDIHIDAQIYEIIKIFCNATLEASYIALKDNYSMVLGGGFHHAKSDSPGGFCVLNDIAIASKVLIDSNMVRNILIIDLDVHQGDGNASIFQYNNSVFTFSIHQEDLFPYEKQVSSLDISLNSNDFKPKIYFYNLKHTLNSILKNKKFSIIYYIAGADTLQGDRLGSFRMSLNDLKKRDSIIFKYAKESKIPIVVLMGGSYNTDMEKEIEAYINTIKLLWSFYL